MATTYGQGKVRISGQGVMLAIEAAYDSGTSGPCTFSASVRGPGDAAFGTPFVPVDDSGNPLHSDGSGYGYDHAQEGPDRWVLCMVAVGDSDRSIWWSADEGRSWKRV